MNMPPQLLSATEPIRGRFAPSPTGVLHFGSVVAALGSYLNAKVQKGQWLLRIEDVDVPRTVPGAADAILRDLEILGLEWDGAVVWQSERTTIYEQVLNDLVMRNWAYPCACTRRQLENAPRAKDGAARYLGTCRQGLPPGTQARAWRLRTDSTPIGFTDAIQGLQTESLAKEVGDIVLRRADGLFAYQLAVVVDDAQAGITEVVRGADLLDSTCRQIHLQRCLGVKTPAYAHLPIALNALGQKLSKQTLARPALNEPAGRLLCKSLRFLGHDIPEEYDHALPKDILAWALTHWQLAKVPRQRAICAPKEFLF